MILSSGLITDGYVSRLLAINIFIVMCVCFIMSLLICQLLYPLKRPLKRSDTERDANPCCKNPPTFIIINMLVVKSCVQSKGCKTRPICNHTHTSHQGDGVAVYRACTFARITQTNQLPLQFFPRQGSRKIGPGRQKAHTHTHAFK